MDRAAPKMKVSRIGTPYNTKHQPIVWICMGVTKCGDIIFCFPRLRRGKQLKIDALCPLLFVLHLIRSQLVCCRQEKPLLPEFREAGVLGLLSYTARSTLPERKQRVQVYTWRGEPSTNAFTRFTFGFHIRLDRLWEWLTLMPKETPLSQYPHFAIFCTSPLYGRNIIVL